MSRAPGPPESALRRVRRQRESGTWNSDLSVSELAAIHSVGFEPAGQVTGSAVYRIAVQGIPTCRTAPPVRSRVTELVEYGRALHDVRRLALDRMAREAVELASHGVVGVRLALRRFEHATDAVEFTAIGTAIRRAGAAPLPHPFLSALDGNDLAKLLGAGLVPCRLLVGVAAVHVHTGESVEAASRSWDAVRQDLSGAAASVRSLAVGRLAEQARSAGADGCVGSHLHLDVWPVRCGRHRGRDHVLQFTAVATAVARFERPVRRTPAPVVSLGDR
jgi:uncharacterized protein YbjQ (UPF0145 family)